MVKEVYLKKIIQTMNLPFQTPYSGKSPKNIRKKSSIKFPNRAPSKFANFYCICLISLSIFKNTRRNSAKSGDDFSTRIKVQIKYVIFGKTDFNSSP